ncbi:MAG: NAD+ synthase [Myxococcales bacterium]|nr:NAD+ synthase [Myxococcales bacterium]
MRILLAQINATIAHIDANVAAIEAACALGRERGVDVVVTPELAVLGYPPLDLLERPDLLAEAEGARTRLAAASTGLTLVVGTALPNRGQIDGRPNRPAINAADVFTDGELVATVAKRLLPTYDVFDEDRYFEPGTATQVLSIAGERVGITICEDIWSDDDNGVRKYDVDPVAALAGAGATLVLNLSASPFDLGKAARRVSLVSDIAREHGVTVAYCNLVGGNDALIFDGRSFVVNATGEVIGSGKGFATDNLFVDTAQSLPKATADAQTVSALPGHFLPPPAVEARAALVLGVRDYLHKCGFSQVVLGLSGGIDSAVTAAIAVEAIGADNVLGVAMPGPYSSGHSVTDALALADNLGIRCPIVPIKGPFEGFKAALANELARPGRDTGGVTEQNLQARARGVILMGLSNHTGRMLLTTGNKSEMAVGYCTLYGDMNGGLAVIGDLPKMLVYDVARTYNTEREVIPVNTIDKPPSAELAPDQQDSDSLPPYPVLDRILEMHLIERLPADDIATQGGFDLKVVRRIVRLTELNEYKRRQAAPVLRVTAKAFGSGRRVPMARRMPPW